MPPNSKLYLHHIIYLFIDSLVIYSIPQIFQKLVSKISGEPAIVQLNQDAMNVMLN